MKTVLAYKPWVQDPALIPLGWRDQSFNASLGGHKKLKIGILWSDDIVKPHPPVRRALQEVADKLKALKDVETVEWKPYKHDLAWEIIVSLSFDQLTKCTKRRKGQSLLPGRRGRDERDHQRVQ